MNLSEAVTKVLMHSSFRNYDKEYFVENNDAIWKDFAHELWGVFHYSDACYDLIDYARRAELKVIEELSGPKSLEHDIILKQLVADAKLAKRLSVIFAKYKKEELEDLSEELNFSISGFKPYYDSKAIERAKKLIGDFSGEDLFNDSSFLDQLAFSIGLVVDFEISKSSDEFSYKLFDYIYYYGLNEVEVYKRAGIGRQQFSKLRKAGYQPKKETIFALIIAMKMNKADATDLLDSAGYSFSAGSKLDQMMEYFIDHELYQMDIINYILYSNRLPVLGSKTREK